MVLFSVVVPVYNSEKTLEELYTRTRAVFDSYREYDFEMILVDDASKDNSYTIMKQLSKNDNRVKIIQFARNYGQHSALMCGIKHSSGDFVITIDDDLQHPPEEIKKLISSIINDESADVVIGKYDSKKHSSFRNLGTWLSNEISYLALGKPKELHLTSFRIMRRYIADELTKINIATPRIGNLLLEITSHIKNVDVVHAKRREGKSGYTLKRLVHDLMTNIFTNTMLPLQLIRNIGIASLVFSFFFALFLFIRYLVRGSSITGWTSLVLIIIIASGLILFALGLVGEYLMRILYEAKKMPNYVERRIDDFEGTELNYE